MLTFRTRFLPNVFSSSTPIGKSSNSNASYAFARIVPFTSKSNLGSAVLIPTFWVDSLTTNDGLVSFPTWKNGFWRRVPFSINLIAKIPSGEVDVILFVKLTGPLNSDGSKRFGPPPTVSVFRMYTSSNTAVKSALSSPRKFSLGSTLWPLKKSPRSFIPEKNTIPPFSSFESANNSSSLVKVLFLFCGRAVE